MSQQGVRRPGGRWAPFAAAVIGALVGPAACGPAMDDCPDSYAACVAHVEQKNATFEECESETRLDVDEICDESALNPDPSVCVDCVDYYECEGGRLICEEDGTTGLQDIQCPPCQ